MNGADEQLGSTSGVFTRAPGVLVVDDDAKLVRSLGRFLRLERPHWRLFTEVSSVRALERLREECLDVVISDLHMPEVNGIELLRVSATAQPLALRILHSGSLALEGAEACQVADLRIAKPASPSEFIRHIERTLTITWYQRRAVETEAR